MTGVLIGMAVLVGAGIGFGIDCWIHRREAERERDLLSIWRRKRRPPGGRNLGP